MAGILVLCSALADSVPRYDAHLHVHLSQFSPSSERKLRKFVCEFCKLCASVDLTSVCVCVCVCVIDCAYGGILCKCLCSVSWYVIAEHLHVSICMLLSWTDCWHLHLHVFALATLLLRTWKYLHVLVHVSDNAFECLQIHIEQGYARGHLCVAHLAARKST